MDRAGDYEINYAPHTLTVDLALGVTPAPMMLEAESLVITVR